ncbi:NAD(P)H-binding protein [Patulibacter sp. SYSU D01012]|uniref:NmrA family NAD(P)-binding protein n=1 Tax=Patulibacter sp. SYSU D01012 TaxID=2817381 RepID=UPI001B306B8E|nr:NAD(P)H-binding protein [Patulibacter sp. SYSU D01012]
MIAVLGGTGTIGRHVTAQLAARGLEHRVLRRPGVDLRDPATLRAGMAGADQLFLLTPHDPDQEQLEADAVDAAVAAGVRRIVKVSGGGPAVGPNGPSSTAVAHWRSEQRIEASGLRHAFLRPSLLMQNLAEMRPRLGLLLAPMGHAPVAMIDAADVAAAAVAALEDRDAPDRCWHLTGPAGVTFADVARAQGARYVDVPPRLAALALRRRGASPFEIDHTLRMAAYFATGADGTPTDDVRRLTGRAPRSLHDHLDAGSPRS